MEVFLVYSLFGIPINNNINTNTVNSNSLFSNQSINNNTNNNNINNSTPLFGNAPNSLQNGQNINNDLSNQNSVNINNNNTNDFLSINFVNNNIKKEEENKPKSLGEILYNKIKETKEAEMLSYNSEYIQKLQDEASKNQNNKYKNYFEISNANNININPIKRNIGSIKEYFNKSLSNTLSLKRAKANSFDLSFNSLKSENNLNNNLMLNFETSFNKKLNLNNNLSKNLKKKITIKCQINEPKKASFTIIIGKKVEMSKLKNTICEQLKKKNKIYANLKLNQFCLMKNYSFVQEFGLVEDTNLTDGDDIFIILKDSMFKAQNEDENKSKFD